MCPLVGYAYVPVHIHMEALAGLCEHFTEMRKTLSWEHTEWDSLGRVEREDEMINMCVGVYAFACIYICLYIYIVHVLKCILKRNQSRENILFVLWDL